MECVGPFWGAGWDGEETRALPAVAPGAGRGMMSRCGREGGGAGEALPPGQSGRASQELRKYTCKKKAGKIIDGTL